MPKYLTISSELQLVPSGGYHSASGKNLEAVFIEVSHWLQKNPEHPLASPVNDWIAAAAADVERHRHERVKQEAVENLEKNLRRTLMAGYRKKGLSLEKAREKGARKAAELARKALE